MMQFRSQSTQGFTLIELLTVIGVMMILSTVVLVGSSQYREYSRDQKRITDLKQYELAFKLYFESYGKYPDCYGAAYLRADGVTRIGSAGSCSDSTTLNSFMLDYFGSMPEDPRDDGASDPTYSYVYDSVHWACDGGGPPILAIKTLESKDVDLGECDAVGPNGGLNTATPYVIRLDSIF